jgi:uncharacterized protein YbjT (DUF2867 family)
MYVMAGVSGHVGSVAARQLLAHGQKVRVIVRDSQKGETWKREGAEVVVGSLEDQGFLEQACSGAEGAFFLLPPNFAVSDFRAYQKKLGEGIARAVDRTGVPHVVLLSSIGANLEQGTGPILGLHWAEDALRATRTRLTALRPGFFMENVAGALAAARGQGIYPDFLPPGAAVPMIATRDIGEQVARELREPPPRHVVVDLWGPAYTATQIAQVLGKLLGRPVQATPIPPEAQVQALVQAGFPRPIAEIFAEMYDCFRQGLARPAGDRHVVGKTTLEEVLRPLVSLAA